MTCSSLVESPDTESRTTPDNLGTGISVSDLAVRVGNTTSSTSRNVAILGDYGRGKSPALQVLKAVTNPLDRRSQLVKLTPKGERVIDQMVEVLNKEV